MQTAVPQDVSKGTYHNLGLVLNYLHLEAGLGSSPFPIPHWPRDQARLFRDLTHVQKITAEFASIAHDRAQPHRYVKSIATDALKRNTLSEGDEDGVEVV